MKTPLFEVLCCFFNCSCLLPGQNRQFRVSLFNILILIAESKIWLLSSISGTTFVPILQHFLFHFYHIKSLKQVQHGGSCSAEGILLSTSMCLRPQQWFSQPQKLSLRQRNVFHQDRMPQELSNGFVGRTRKNHFCSIYL